MEKDPETAELEDMFIELYNQAFSVHQMASNGRILSKNKKESLEYLSQIKNVLGIMQDTIKDFEEYWGYQKIDKL
jgi:hypothetical protein